MRKVVLKIHVSLDGYVRGPDGDVMDWVFRSYDDELRDWEVDQLWQAGTHVMGRKLYAEMAAYWPTSDEPFAPPMNEILKVVFSTTLAEASWAGTRIVRGDVAEEIVRLRQEPGKDILLHGGPTLIRTLVEHRLIDEYRLVVHPVALGGGLPLFQSPLDLRLIGVRAFPGGAVALRYSRSVQ